MPIPPMGSRPNAKRPKNRFGFSMFWMYAVIILFLFGMYYMDNNSMNREVDYSTFESYLYKGGFTKMVVYIDKMKLKES